MCSLSLYIHLYLVLALMEQQMTINTENNSQSARREQETVKCLALNRTSLSHCFPSDSGVIAEDEVKSLLRARERRYLSQNHIFCTRLHSCTHELIVAGTVCTRLEQDQAMYIQPHNLMS